ncbi:MAG: peptidylprolyl isomerase [Pirellulales bacterium]
MSKKPLPTLSAPPSRKRGTKLLVFFGGLSVILACAAIRFADGDRPVEASAPVAQPSAHPIAAEVDGHKITRRQLGEKCLQQFGESVLETVVNRHLIEQQCRQHNITISAAAVDKEIEQIAQRFGLPVDQWMELLATERNILPDQYREEIVWPMLALRELAATQLTVSEAEIQEEMNSRFGKQIKARIIVVSQRKKAEQIRAAAVANPADFAKLAATHSIDDNSASAGGLIQPIRRNMGDVRIEQAAFALQEGQVSEIIPLGDQYVLVRCEGHIPAKEPGNAQLKQVRSTLVDYIQNRKLREVGAKLFRDLQQHARLENVWNDATQRQRMPGVAAMLNGQAITMNELQDACIARHGKEVLENMINQVVLERELAKTQLRITQDEINHEVARAAIDAGFVDPQGKPDLPKWIKTITNENEISRATYEANIVWPTVALKKLVGKITVADEELTKAFEANYGPRVRCRAIVLDNIRRAQEVWKAARNKPTPEYFAELAAQYSIDSASRATGGIVPPIQKHGGQQALETEAFRLKPGELSGVIQVAGKFVVLLCEGITEPVVVEFSEVRDLLYQDLLEKKYRLAMARHFEKLIASARITNNIDPQASQAPNSGTVRNSSGRRATASKG